MYQNRRSVVISCLFLVIACLIAVRGLRVTQADPESSWNGSEQGIPFVDADLADLPRTWYCLTRWINDPAKQHEAISFSAWRLFLALNWPGEISKDENNPIWRADDKLDGLNKTGKYPRWSSWHSPQTLRVALSKCDSEAPPRPDWTDHPDTLAPELEIPWDDGEHRKTPPCVYDQNGELVEYEIRMRQEGWVSNIYEIACPPAQKCPLNAEAPLNTEAHFSFQYGQCQGQGPSNDLDPYNIDGAVAIRLAWKVLSRGEIENGRYLQRKARVQEACDDKGKLVVKIVGLVGLNITQKTNRYGEWIWSTFEHVDNLAPGDGATAASFYDPQCRDCIANTSQRLSSDARCRTQITRDRPIPDDIKSLNEKMRMFLKGRSVLQYYRLIGVQYVPHSSPSSSGDSPKPAELRNPVIETYDVARGSENPPDPPGSCFEHPKSEKSSCIGCHKYGSNFSFVPGFELCNCRDKKYRWIGDAVCQKLGFDNCGKGASR